MLVRILLVVAGLAAGYLALTPTGHYLVRAAWEEGKILTSRQPIPALVRDGAVAPLTREKLQLVLAARGFAEDSVGLRTKQSFTQFTQLERDTLVLVLSGAYRDRLKSHTWWFPVVGRVPYKGFFDFGQARRSAEALRQRGFDVYLRPASAFSTLGWFDDPLLSSTLRADTLDLANTVIHELTHNTFYAPGQAVFNESFANFVGARGAAWFFRSRGQERAAQEVEAQWADDKLLAQFWARLYRTVDSAFKAHPGDDAAAVARRIAVRDTLFAQARQELVFTLGPQLRTIGPRALERMRIDNAALLARRVYLTDIELFDAIWVREGRDLKRAMARIIALAKSDRKRPYDALRRELGLPIPADSTEEG